MVLFSTISGLIDEKLINKVLHHNFPEWSLDCTKNGPIYTDNKKLLN